MTDRQSTGPTPAQLRALVRSAPQTPGRNEALLDLLAEAPPGLDRTLRTLALDPKRDRAMRLHAVSALGRRATPASRRALREALSVDDEVVRRRAVARLGKIGTPEDLEMLKAVRTGNAATHRTLRAAKCFLSYRHRMGQYRHDTPQRTYAATTSDAVQMRTGALTKTLRSRVELGGVDVPGLDGELDAAWRLECPSESFVFVPNHDVAGETMLTLAESQAMPGVLVSQNVETGTFDPAFYITTDPAGHDRFHVFGVRGSGAVALYGTGAVDDGVVSFDVTSTDRPLVPPVTVRATYTVATGRVRFQTALVEPRFSEGQQRRRRQPREG